MGCVNNPVQTALLRLSASLDRLDAISLRYLESDRLRADLEMELAVMRDDRQKLAQMLDQERAQRLEACAGLTAIAPKIDAAMLAIRESLDGA
jgi:Domain of unknown function (DUF4164)